jgi:hypothetical protein
MPKTHYGSERRGSRSAAPGVRRRRWVALSLAAGAVNLACAAGWAGTDNWIGGTSDWNTPGNWDSGNVPLDGDTVNIINTDGSSPTIDYDYNGAAATLFSLTLDNSVGVETLSMQTAGLALTADGETIGNTGTAALFQAASLNTITGSAGQLVLGSTGGSSGTYTLQDGTVQLIGVSSTESIGAGGSGLFSQSGGLNSVTAAGSEEFIGAQGEYTQSGGVNTAVQVAIQSGNYSLSSQGLLTVGNLETLDFGATFNQTGGTNSVGSSILIGDQPSSSGTYNMSGGTLQVGFGVFAGYGGTGTFIQTDGTAAFVDLAVGFHAGSSGAYTLGPAGSLSVTTSALIGYLGQGSFTQTGGVNTIGSSLYLGYGSTGSGAFNLNGGALNSGSEYIGYGGTGSFTQTAGVNSISSGHSMYLGYLPGATGTYALSNTGTLTSLGSEFVGYGNVGPAAGVFTQDGGLNCISGTSGNLSLGTSTNSSGSYTLTDGTVYLMGSLTAETIGAYGTGTFIQSAGMNCVNGIGESVGDFPGSNGYYELDGGVNDLSGSSSTLCIGNNAGANGLYFLSAGTLNTANIFVGGNNANAGGTGSLIVSGTGQVTATNGITLYNTPGSDIIVDSGTLSAGIANLNGPLTQNAGSVSFQKITGQGQIIISGGQMELTPHGGTSTVASLILSGSGTVDVTDNTLVINYGSGSDPVVAVAAALNGGYSGGTWTGMGIVSSIAASNPTLFSVGYLDSSDPGGVANTVLVKFTLAGDALLNGTVNFNDLAIVGQHLNTTGNDWSQGNFTYSLVGAVNFSDLLVIGQNLNKTLNGSLSEPPQTILPLSASVQVPVQNTIVTPEPTALALSAMAGAALLGRRRRRRDSQSRAVSAMLSGILINTLRLRFWSV